MELLTATAASEKWVMHPPREKTSSRNMAVFFQKPLRFWGILIFLSHGRLRSDNLPTSNVMVMSRVVRH